MAGRNDAAINAALEAMAQALEHQPNGGENAASRNLDTFQRENPPVFKGTHDSDGALTWLKDIGRIFCVMDCSPEKKCIKFENGLRSEIKKVVDYQKIRVFADLVDCCRIFEEYSNAHYKMVHEKRSKSQQVRGKPYDAPSGKNKQRAYEGNKTSGGDAPAGIVCFKCGKADHKSNVCTA
ncbi:uncharacterized protein LOC131659345 [Vicia villosa]|uniref:uncharacterized protein LOC131659345 n=1 Tax=Vicia villosa TaxID=3911 RepID=UPI00273AC685|nr:uncharacterized protein LOC131659345 [Vicia villosa]